MRNSALTAFVLVAIVIFSMDFSYASSRRSRTKDRNLKVGARVSLYNPPGTSITTMLFEVTAKYRVSDRFAAEFSAGWTQYNEEGRTTTLIPIQINGEFHPFGKGVFDPFVGGGVGAYLKKWGDEQSATVGVQALGGFEFRPTTGFSMSLSVKYILSDITDPRSGGFSFGGGVQGNWETSF